jgi:hypothetical protein
MAERLAPSSGARASTRNFISSIVSDPQISAQCGTGVGIPAGFSERLISADPRTKVRSN